MGSQSLLMRAMKAAKVVCLAVVISHASFGTELEAEDLVQLLQDPAESTTQVSYSSVPGFALKDGATKADANDKDACLLKCTGEPTCRSASFAPKSADHASAECYWSTESLNFDPAFVMMTKAHHSAEATKKFRTFQGLTYRAKGWLKVMGKTLDQCESLCTESKTCEALSYREEDLMCLLSPKGIHYSNAFTYYEKKGETMSTMPITKQGGAKMPSDEKQT